MTQTKLDKLNLFVNTFKKLPVLQGNLDYYTLTIKNNDEYLEIDTIEKEWHGCILRNITKLVFVLDLQFYIERKTCKIIIH